MVEDELSRLLESESPLKVDDGFAQAIHQDYINSAMWVEFRNSEAAALFFLKRLARAYEPTLDTYLYAYNATMRGRFMLEGTMMYGFFWNNGGVITNKDKTEYITYIHLMEVDKWEIPHE